MGWVWLVQEEEEEVAPRQEKMVFTVKLTQFDAAKKVQLIKAIKSLIPNMNLVQVRQSLCVCSVFIKAIKSLIPNMNLVQVRQSLCVCSVFIKAIKSLIPNMNLVQVRQSLCVCSVFIKAIKSLIPNMNLVQVRQSLSVCSVFSGALHPQRPSMLSCLTFFMEVLSIKCAYSGVTLFKVVHYQFMARVRKIVNVFITGSMYWSQTLFSLRCPSAFSDAGVGGKVAWLQAALPRNPL